MMRCPNGNVCQVVDLLEKKHDEAARDVHQVRNRLTCYCAGMDIIRDALDDVKLSEEEKLAAIRNVMKEFDL